MLEGVSALLTFTSGGGDIRFRLRNYSHDYDSNVTKLFNHCLAEFIPIHTRNYG